MLNAWGDEKFIQNFSEKTSREQPFGRPRHRWKKNIKMYIKQTEREGVNQWQVLVNMVMKLWVT
jgi:hypothetical protein